MTEYSISHTFLCHYEGASFSWQKARFKACSDRDLAADPINPKNDGI